VETAYHVWCNGKLVGYGEGTHTPGRFDISEAVRRGDNVLAVEVYQVQYGQLAGGPGLLVLFGHLQGRIPLYGAKNPYSGFIC
jgi:beta-galactosidase